MRFKEAMRGEGLWWQGLYDWWNLYGRFDDGGLAAMINDKVVRFLDAHWGDFHHLAALMKDDFLFRAFILGNINEMAQIDLKPLSVKAREKCPGGYQAMCAKVARAVEQFLSS